LSATSNVPLADTTLVSNPSTTPDRNYLSIIGVLLYLAQGTRPNISFATHYLARFLLNPDDSHWTAVKKLVAYVRATRHFELQVVPREDGPTLKIFVDASWMGEGARSHHGFVATLWNVPIAWSARRQVAPARSTCQAEYVALSAASVEAIWLAEMLGGLLGTMKPVMYCDNRAAVKIATNKASVVKAKNIN
jgi:hypothetical protein